MNKHKKQTYAKCISTVDYFGTMPKTTSFFTYRIYSNRRRGVYVIFHDPAAAFIRGRCLFGGGVYSKTTLFSTKYRTLYCIFLLANSNESQYINGVFILFIQL